MAKYRIRGIKEEYVMKREYKIAIAPTKISRVSRKEISGTYLAILYP